MNKAVIRESEEFHLELEVFSINFSEFEIALSSTTFPKSEGLQRSFFRRSSSKLTLLVYLASP